MSGDAARRSACATNRADLIAVAMSGGVDSSVVAASLKRQGYNLAGLTMQLWNQRRLPEIATEATTGRCCSLDDVYDARRVAEHVGLPYYVVNLERQFEESVVEPFVGEYLAGRTPVPCTLCNTFIKPRPVCCSELAGSGGREGHRYRTLCADHPACGNRSLGATHRGCIPQRTRERIF